MTGLFRGKPIDYNNPDQCKAVIEYLSNQIDELREKPKVGLEIRFNDGLTSLGPEGWGDEVPDFFGVHRAAPEV